MDKLSHPLICVGCNYSSMLKFQWRFLPTTGDRVGHGWVITSTVLHGYNDLPIPLSRCCFWLFLLITEAPGKHRPFWCIMTSSNGNIFFRVTGPLWGEFTGPQWIPLTKASDAELWCMFSLMCAGTNGWVNSREAGDLRRRRTHYDVTVMDVVLTISWHQVRCNDHVGLPSARILWIYIIVTIYHVHFYHDWLCHMVNGRQFADGSFTYHFLMKLLYLIQFSLKFVPWAGSDWQLIIIGSDNGLAPSRRQSIIWPS